jgi:hypothetical protein
MQYKINLPVSQKNEVATTGARETHFEMGVEQSEHTL